jgi:uncharacterized integral membrane protein
LITWMNKLDLYKIVGLLLLLNVALFVAAQNKTSVKAAVDRNKIFIGERIQLTLQVNIPENEPIRFFYIDTIPHFELNKQKVDTSNTSTGTFLKQIINITSFDSGHWVIPAFVLGDTIATDTIPVDVAYSPMDTAQAYHDIKDIIAVKPEEPQKPWWIWAAIGGGLVIIIILLIYLMSRRKPVATTPVVVIPPFEEAMKQLERLQQERPAQKQYYSRLVDIFRVYVNQKKGIHSLQKTTDDLVIQLRGVPIPKLQFERLSQALRLSDFVKFAKYVPSAEDDRNALEAVKDCIVSIEKINEPV